jgi:hypothetical protein
MAMMGVSAGPLPGGDAWESGIRFKAGPDIRTAVRSPATLPVAGGGARFQQHGGIPDRQGARDGVGSTGYVPVTLILRRGCVACTLG